MNTPLVSVIIRTCGRPQVLAKALKSVQAQRYPAIEAVIVEDDKNISEQFIREKFSAMNISYQCTGHKCGRCISGNLGLEAAKGEYLNFLDDDDILLPNHVETLVRRLENSPFYAAYAIAQEHQTSASGTCPPGTRVRRKLIRYRQPFNRLLLCYMNYIPIQSIMFHRKVYAELGGFDEQMELLEDWDLWVRYAARYDFLYVPTVTSVYYTPYKGRQKQLREHDMHAAMEMALNKYQHYQMNLSAAQISRDMDYIVNTFNKKGVLFYMQKIRNYLLYRDI